MLILFSKSVGTFPIRKRIQVEPHKAALSFGEATATRQETGTRQACSQAGLANMIHFWSPEPQRLLSVRHKKIAVARMNDKLMAPSTEAKMNWAESMPHEYQVRETADLSALDNGEFAELKRLNDKVVSRY